MTGRKLVLLWLAAVLPLLLMRWTRADDPAPARSPDKGAADRDPQAPNPAPPPRDDQGPRDTRGPRDERGPSDGQPPGSPPGRPGERSPGPPGPGRFPGPGRPQFGVPGGAGGLRVGPGGEPMMIDRNDPEMVKLYQQEGELDRQTRQLAGEFREAPADKKDEIKKKLQETVAQHFEVRQQRRALELKRLEAELTRLRESMENRNKEKQQIIDRRVSELLGQDDNQF